MRFLDFSPPASPSPNEQRDALQKGLGRARQWALAGRLADGPLLDACLCDQRFDQQCEDRRGEWLWNIVQDVGAQDRFRDTIFEALGALPDESAAQLCELARHFARSGDEQFRSRLYEIVELKPLTDRPWLGEAEIIDLDGEDAFLFAAGVRGERLATGEWDWDDGSLTFDAVERFGEERIVSLLAASTDVGIKRFYECWRQQDQAKSSDAEAHRDRMRSFAVHDILEAANGQDKCYWFRGWGMYADEPDLRAILSALRAADDPNVIGRLLQVFSNRALPEFDPRLIELCQHDDDNVWCRAFTALALNADAAVRSFALEQLAIEATRPVISLFARNFRPGDEQRILEAMRLPEEPCELHWLLRDVLDVLERNPEAECSQLAIITYGSTPCQNCRFYAARVLHKQDTAPAWLIEECRFDADERCRRLFTEQASK